MAIEVTTPRSRRAILTAALGAGAATIAAALGRPLAVKATDGQNVLVGGYFSSDRSTVIDAVASGATAIIGDSALGAGLQGASNSGSGVIGESHTGTGVYAASVSGSAVIGDAGTGNGVHGFSRSTALPAIIGQSLGGSTGVQGYSGAGAIPAAPAGTGVHGSSTAGTGVRGDSTSGNGLWGSSSSGYGAYASSSSQTGVYGLSSASVKPAVLGLSLGSNTGVQGCSGPFDTPPVAPAKTGVYGYAAQDALARGVTGQTTLGYGVSGIATTGCAVNGSATTGTGGSFSTSNAKVGTALRTVGKLKFDKSVGVATIAKGRQAVVVTPGLDLTATSAVVATLMGSAGGTTAVRCAIVNATADKITIYLTAKATVAVTVAWHVFG